MSGQYKELSHIFLLRLISVTSLMTGAGLVWCYEFMDQQAEADRMYNEAHKYGSSLKGLNCDVGCCKKGSYVRNR